MGVQALVDEVSCSQEETIVVTGGFGPDGPQPLATGKCFREFVSGLGVVSLNC